MTLRPVAWVPETGSDKMSIKNLLATATPNRFSEYLPARLEQRSYTVSEQFTSYHYRSSPSFSAIDTWDTGSSSSSSYDEDAPSIVQAYPAPQKILQITSLPLPRVSKVIHSRNVGHSEHNPKSFGKHHQGRYYCTYVHPGTRQECQFWSQGYTNWTDLARHADGKHGAEECNLLKKGYLSFEAAQWVTSQSQMDALGSILAMRCPQCGTQFPSSRMDSLTRHMKNGACLRAQERLRRSTSSMQSRAKKVAGIRKKRKVSPNKN